MRWRTQTSAASSLREAVCSWHGLSKLTRALHRVQQYVENRPRATPLSRGSIGNISAVPSKRKRSSLDNETTLSRDTALGIITPSHSSDRSRATSVIASESSEQDAYVYNGVLERREGWIVAKKVSAVRFPHHNHTITLVTHDSPSACRPWKSMPQLFRLLR